MASSLYAFKGEELPRTEPTIAKTLEEHQRGGVKGRAAAAEGLLSTGSERRGALEGHSCSLN